jgi:alpha-ketoglutarate-dependent taurine dioxygenase
MLGEAVAEHASQLGYTLVKNCDFTRDQFEELISGIGSLSAHRFGTGKAGLLDLDASPEPDKVVTGQAPLPLHTDGTLVQASPKYIALYCHLFDQPLGSGLTEVCVQADIVQTAPPHLRKVLSLNWEYYVTDSSHFPDVANRWQAIPATVVGNNGVERLNIAMPFVGGEVGTSGWQVRLPGHNAEESNAVLGELDEHFRSSASFYSHQWEPGDLLVIDNELVIHGRTRVHPGGSRHLYRGQVNV